VSLLLDTNVVSELRKAKTGKINPNVKAWADSVVTTDLFISVVTLLEIEMGIGLMERRDLVQGHYCVLGLIIMCYRPLRDVFLLLIRLWRYVVEIYTYQTRAQTVTP